MKMKQMQDKQNTELVAKFKFFFDNDIVVERHAVWAVDYAKLLKTLAPNSEAVDLALGKGGKILNHRVYSEQLYHGLRILHTYFHSEDKDIRELRATDATAMATQLDYLERHRTRATKFVEYAEWMLKEHADLCKPADDEWGHSVLAMALAVAEECPINMHMRAVPTFTGLKQPEVLRWLSYVAGKYPVDRYCFDRVHAHYTPAALAMVQALAAYEPLMIAVVGAIAEEVFDRDTTYTTYTTATIQNYVNQKYAEVEAAARYNDPGSTGDANSIVNGMNALVEGYELRDNFHCIANSVFPALVL